MNGWKGERMNGRMNGWMDGMDGPVDLGSPGNPGQAIDKKSESIDNKLLESKPLRI